MDAKKGIFNSQINITKNQWMNYIKNISIVYKNNKNVQNLEKNGRT